MITYLPELMNVTEVCRELGIRTSNIDKQAGLPEPVRGTRGNRDRLWLADDIRRFAAERKERKA